MPDSSATPKALNAQEVRSLYSELRASFSGRNEDYRIARDRYNGNHWDGVTLAAHPERYSLTLNYIRPTVDKVVRGIIGEMPGIQVMPPGTDDLARRLAEQEEAILYTAWEANNAPLVFRRVIHNMVLLRRGVLYYWWDARAKMVRFRSIAPDNYFPVYDGEDVVECIIVSRRNTRVLKQMYPDLADKIHSDGETDAVIEDQRYASATSGANMATEPLTGTTIVLDWYNRDGDWVRVMGDAEHSANLSYGTGRVPVIEFQNNVRGDEREPGNEIDDIVELNQYLDQLISQGADIIKRYANPTIVDYGSGQDPQHIRDIIRTFGGVIPSRKDGKVAFLNWEGQPPDILNQRIAIMQAIHDLSGQPASAYGQTVTNQSGVMTNMSMTPSVATATDKQEVVGAGLILLNEDILRLYEKFMAGDTIKARGMRAKRPGLKRFEFFEVEITGSEIAGWYKNRIKWPSALRTDDPVFVQSEISKMTAQPPVQSVYTTAENLGIEDVEAELDRVKAQLEDPRFHPDRLAGAVDAAAALSEVPELPPEMTGLDPGASVTPDSMNTAAEGAGNPNRDQLVDGSKRQY